MSARWRTIRDLLLVTFLGLPLIQPLLRWSAVPCTHDGHLHYHRVAAMRHAWENGLWFSRWLPDLAFGLGYPFFVYREPLPLYVTLWLHQLGLPLPAATNLFYVATILLAGVFTYLWVRDLFGPLAGVVAGVAYMAAPYQLVDALVRGNQVESVALALFPLLLWAGRRFMLYGTWGSFLAAVGGLAILGLSHNISLLIFTPSLFLYLLVLALAERRRRPDLSWWRGLLAEPRLQRLVLIFLLGIGVTLFYSAVAVLEIDRVTLTQSVTTRNNDFRYNFASLGEIFSPVTPEDPGLLNPPMPLRLGWVPAALALLGLLTWPFLRRRERKVHLLLMGGGALVYLLLALPISRPIWEWVPLVEFIQFPWRFVGRAALPVAFLAGVPFGLLAERYGARNELARIDTKAAKIREIPRPLRTGSRNSLPALIPAALAILLLLAEAAPNTYPAICTEEPYPTILTVHQYERETGLVGVDPEGSYFPVTVEQRPEGSVLEEDYVAGRTPRRFDAGALPPGARILVEAYGPNRAEIEVESPTAFTARYWTFAFPGWEAAIDGEPAVVEPEAPSGVMTFGVPAGRHTITVQWTATPLRRFFGAISLLALGGIGVALLVLVDTRWRRPGPRPATLAAPAVALLLLLGAGWLAFKVGVVDRQETPWRRAAAPPVETRLELSGGPLRLVGYTLSRDVVPADGPLGPGTVDVDLAWRVAASPERQYQSNLWLVDDQGVRWSAKDTQRTRIYEDPPPMVFWQPGQWAWDSREVALLPGIPPGEYDLVLTLFARETLEPLTLTGAGDQVIGPEAIIGRVAVEAPAEPQPLEPPAPVGVDFGGTRLLGVALDRERAAPGDPLLLTFYWEKQAAAASPPLSLALRDGEGNVVRQWALPYVREDFPPARWAVGDRWRGQHPLRLPAALESGVHELWLGEIRLGELVIEAPPRTFEEPASNRPIGVTLGEAATLTGATIEPAGCLDTPGAVCTLTLIWRAQREMATSYRVFVHAVDDGGAIITQSDGEPARWTRPTTGWAPGEYVIDTHTLQLPAELPNGGLSLRVGLYDPATGVRLLTPVGADHIPLQ